MILIVGEILLDLNDKTSQCRFLSPKVPEGFSTDQYPMGFCKDGIFLVSKSNDKSDYKLYLYSFKNKTDATDTTGSAGSAGSAGAVGVELRPVTRLLGYNPSIPGYL